MFDCIVSFHALVRPAVSHMLYIGYLKDRTNKYFFCLTPEWILTVPFLCDYNELQDCMFPTEKILYMNKYNYK